jgi:antitoxin (DNA-binding transcriptional repressor) of toxin-antitoxin stability system
MERRVSQRELRDDSDEIMRGLDRGESYVVTRNGVPVGELVPSRRHRFVSAETAVEVFRAGPALDYERFRRDLDALASRDHEPRA